MRNIDVNGGGTVLNKSIQFLSYADDVDCITKTLCALLDGYTQLKIEAEKMGLYINEDKY